MRRVAAALAAIIAILSLSACKAAPEHGTVVGKDHDAAWTQIITTPPVCSNNICPGGTTIPIYFPESWTLTLRDGDNTGDRDVSLDVWMKYEVGQEYP